MAERPVICVLFDNDDKKTNNLHYTAGVFSRYNVEHFGVNAFDVCKSTLYYEIAKSIKRFHKDYNSVSKFPIKHTNFHFILTKYMKNDNMLTKEIESLIDKHYNPIVIFVGYGKGVYTALNQIYNLNSSIDIDIDLLITIDNVFPLFKKKEITEQISINGKQQTRLYIPKQVKLCYNLIGPKGILAGDRKDVKNILIPGNVEDKLYISSKNVSIDIRYIHSHMIELLALTSCIPINAKQSKNICNFIETFLFQQFNHW